MERASRATDLEEDATNFRIERLMVEGSVEVVVREVKNWRACLLRAHDGRNICGGGGWLQWWFRGGSDESWRQPTMAKEMGNKCRCFILVYIYSHG